jgi:hypothetical protein
VDQVVRDGVLDVLAARVGRECVVDVADLDDVRVGKVRVDDRGLGDPLLAWIGMCRHAQGQWHAYRAEHGRDSRELAGQWQ